MKRSNRLGITIFGASLVWRVCWFVIIFVVIAGLLGSRIIGGGLVNKYGFAVYGGAGKALLFGIICFGLLAARRKRIPVITNWAPINLFWLLLCLISFFTAWLGVNKLLSGNDSGIWIALTHVSLLSSTIFAALGSFGLSTLRQLSLQYGKELLTALTIGFVFVGFLYLVYGLWHVLAGIVIHSVRWLLAVTGLSVFVVPPHTLLLSKFSIDISQYCSGIDSIALFTGLYIIVGVLDWHRFNHRRYLLTFLPALLVLFGLNIVRVYALILAGYYINVHIAFSLFHTYAGMVFFILYSGAFWYLAYDRLLNKQTVAD